MAPFPRLRASYLIALAPWAALRLAAQVTETPTTIAPGQVQLRVDAISVGLNPDNPAPNEARAVGVAWPLLSAGLTSDVDAEFGAQFFVEDTAQLATGNQTHSGIGEFTLRTKWTFWRDADSGQAAALVPYINLPTRSQVAGNGHTEGGLIVPWAIQFNPEVKAGAMAELDDLRNAANTRYDTRLSASGVLQTELLHRLGAYGEVTVSTSTAGSSSSWGSVNGGATLSVTDNFQWDLEVGRVVGPSASSWVETLRFRWRL